MSAERRFVCIVCPRGCSLEAGLDEAGKFASVKGNACRRGEDYARSELTDPRRSLTSTVRVELAAPAAYAARPRRRLPVRTSGTIPLGRLREAARALDSIVVTNTVKCGDVLASDFLGLGVDIVATDSLERRA